MKLIDLTRINQLIDGLLDKINDKYATKAELNSGLKGKAEVSHGTHLTLGTTSSTAFRGDYGNTAYKHSQAAHAPSNAQKNSDITKAEIEAKLTGTITSHTHSNSTTTSSGFMSKEDKVKLNSIESNANNYKHPSTHNASMIVQDKNNRFVTDIEKANWDSKANSIDVYTKAELDKILENLLSNNVDINDEVVSEDSTWSSKKIKENITMNDGTTVKDAINANKTSILNNTNNIGNLTTKVNNGQNYKLTGDNGDAKFVDSGTFDDIIDTGIYNCSNSVGGAKPNPNYGGYYHLEVINADTSNNKWITQRATIFEGIGHGIQVYTRICQNGTWTHWGRNNVDGQATKMTADHGACRGIPNNNANDIDITGFWMGANVINAPTGVVGEWIYIESLVHNSLYQVQKATDLHDSSKRWTRHKTGGNWSEWRSL